MKNWLIFFCVILVKFSLNAQVINSIDYKGNKKTKVEVFKKLTSLKIGKKLDSVALNNDVLLFGRLPACSIAKYAVVKNIAGNYDVLYTVEETQTMIPAVNFWTANSQKFSYQLGIKEFNFLGENKQLGGFYRNNGFHSFSVYYEDPFLLNAKTGLSLITQRLTSLEPLYFEKGNANYKYTNTSIEASMIRRLSSSHKVDFGINVFQEKYQYVDGYQSPDVPERLTELKLILKTNFDYNKLIYEYQYVDGFRSKLTFQQVIPLNKKQRKFQILWNDFFYYKRIKQKGNFATRLRVGIATNDNNPFAPFSLDNNLNIRGVGNMIDRGTAVTVLNTEYRHTVIAYKWFAMQANVFIDAGGWRSAGGGLKEIVSKDGMKLHSGLGLRFIHKKIYNAVFRIDYGKSLLDNQQQGLVFGIGQYF